MNLSTRNKTDAKKRDLYKLYGVNVESFVGSMDRFVKRKRVERAKVETDEERMTRRQKRLDEIRENALPEKKKMLAEITRFYEDDGRLERRYVEQIFKRIDLELNPRLHGTGKEKALEGFMKARRKYDKRMIELPDVAINNLTVSEKQTLERYTRHLRAWINYIESPDRDFEVVNGEDHTAVPNVYNSERCLITPLLTDKPSKREVVAQDDFKCGSCGGSNPVPDSEGCLVCSDCGLASSYYGYHTDALSLVPFDHYIHIRKRQGYDKTENFVKKIDLYNSGSAESVPSEVIDFVRKRIPSDTIQTYNFYKDVLKRGRFSRYYPHIPAIIRAIHGCDYLTITLDQRDELIRMHHNYKIAFAQCPMSLRQRTSSLNNNFLIRFFAHMRRFGDIVIRVPMLKGEAKIREHYTVMRWIVNFVQKNIDPTWFFEFIPTHNLEKFYSECAEEYEDDASTSETSGSSQT